jgi:hypothetical protein
MEKENEQHDGQNETADKLVVYRYEEYAGWPIEEQREHDG